MIRRLFHSFIDSTTTATELININPTVQWHGFESLNWIYSFAPCFPIKGQNVQIILEPSIFYNTIVDNCKSAKNRIVLASLYLGNGNLENELVNVILKNLQTNPSLKINILLDFARGTRGVNNSKQLLLPLIIESKNVLCSLYHTPELRGLKKKLAPSRWNELIGLQHMKVYLFDNTVIISGANLSNDYFTNRQDRYIMIEDKTLADFYAKLIGKVQEFSLAVSHNGEYNLHPSWQHLPYDGGQMDFVQEAKQRIGEFFDRTYQTQNKVQDNDADTWIFPLIEMGQLGIHHDSVITQKLLYSSLTNSQLIFATGYFNLTDELMKALIKNCSANCKILMAHPSANGFYHARGPAGGIPSAYTLLAKQFYNKLANAHQNSRIHLYEYEREGWTYHAKGLWYYLLNSSLPNLTMIGSSNFGQRSVNRDLESQICLVTVNESLQKQLQSEVDNLFMMASSAESKICTRPIPMWVRLVVKFFRTYF